MRALPVLIVSKMLMNQYRHDVLTDISTVDKAEEIHEADDGHNRQVNLVAQAAFSLAVKHELGRNISTAKVSSPKS